ncbi:MAG: AAA domain-containing protein [Candidatus Latescibacteria bacterium]|nr:AAA domain-containing protein [Candidatus Latescibacterota bacterium]
MSSNWQRLDQLRSVRLRLEVPLSGPYTRLLRRPVPELAALAQGETIVVVRAARFVNPLPLYPATASPYYYRQGRSGGGIVGDDFKDPSWAAGLLQDWMAPDQVDLLGVPVAHVPLPNEAWVGQFVAQFTPWRAEPVERWRQGVERTIWLHILRVYRFEPVSIQAQENRTLRRQVAPFRAQGVRPVLEEDEFQVEMEQVLEGVQRAREQPQSQAVENGPQQESFSLAELAAQTGYQADDLEAWSRQLRRKKQMVLYGPPGSGKTFLAQQLARYITAGGQGIWELVQFHPSYAYEDFVQGLRPLSRDGALVYERVEGHLLQFCRRAAAAGGHPCVLIIDEMNRAALAQVLGELMYLLEYRQQTVALAGGGPPWSMPDNVYLLGTMNTADRSIALVDQALRRRFVFVRLQPDLDLLQRYWRQRGWEAGPLVKLLAEINQDIGDADRCLGISFFLQEGMPGDLQAIWQGEIEPYLEEVFYDRPEQTQKWAWEAVVERLQGQ